MGIKENHDQRFTSLKLFIDLHDMCMPLVSFGAAGAFLGLNAPALLMRNCVKYCFLGCVVGAGLFKNYSFLGCGMCTCLYGMCVLHAVVREGHGQD
jgi:hypothetical protein